MNIDPVKLEQDIDSIPGICADGKKGIKKLFENHFNVVFKQKITDIKAGQVYSGCNGQQHYVVISVNSYYLFRNLNMWTYPATSFYDKMSYSELLDSLNSYRTPFILVADSLEEFYKNKFAKQ